MDMRDIENMKPQKPESGQDFSWNGTAFQWGAFRLFFYHRPGGSGPVFLLKFMVMQYIIFLLLVSTSVYGQQVKHFRPYRGNLQGARISDIWPTGKNEVWIRQDQPYLPGLVLADSVQYFSQIQTSVNPSSNPLIGVWRQTPNQSYLIFQRLPGYSEGILGPANGGIARYQNGNFLLFNSQNTPTFSGMKERNWYASA
jgi:hypothetical protein